MTLTAVWQTYLELGATAYNAGEESIGDMMLEAAASELSTGSLSVKSALAMCDLAACYSQQRRYRKAMRLFKRALPTLENGKSPHPKAVEALDSIADIYFAVGKVARARPFVERAVKIAESQPIPDAGYPRRLRRLALIFCQMGQADDVTSLLLRAKGCN